MKNNSNNANTKRPTHKQALILRTKQEHPDLTVREVASIAGTTHPHVIRTLREYGITDRHKLEQYKQNRADILANIQANSVEAYYRLSDANKEKLVMKRGLVDMGIAFDKERLERDLPTANIVNVIADIEALRAAREAKKSE